MTMYLYYPYSEVRLPQIKVHLEGTYYNRECISHSDGVGIRHNVALTGRDMG
jgi:hypothetical protein